jgi:hypothetical protein
MVAADGEWPASHGDVSSRGFRVFDAACGPAGAARLRSSSGHCLEGVRNMWLIGQMSTATRKHLSANGIGFASCLILGVALGGLTGPGKAPVQTIVRTMEKPVVDTIGMERFRKQVEVLTAQRDSACAALADTQRRLRGTRRTIRRYREELSYVDELNATLLREAR